METETASTKGSSPGPLLIFYSFWLRIFMSLLRENDWVSDSSACSWDASPWWVPVFNINMISFASSYFISSCLLVSILMEVCSFLMRDAKSVHLVGTGSREYLGGVGRKTIIRIY